MNMRRLSKSLALATPLAGAVISDAQAGGYIKIGDIKGESVDAGFEEYIKIGSFKVEIDGRGSGGEPSQIEFKQPQISFPVEQASPRLMLACATGEVLPKATLVLTRDPGDGTEVAYYKIVFSDVIVTSYSSSGSADGAVPTEDFTLNFSKIEFEYVKYSRSGEVEGTFSTGRISANK